MLRRLRDAAGFTQTEAGKRLGCGQSKINKIEANKLQLRREDRDILLDLYQASGEDRRDVMRLSTVAQPGAELDSNFVDFLECEQKAEQIFAFHSERIPGVLQTEQYMLTQYQVAEDPVQPSAVLAQRDDRRRLFVQDAPPRYHVILSESSLWRMPGGRSALATDQAQGLLNLGAKFEHVSIRIVLIRAGLPALDYDFTVLKAVRGVMNPATGKEKRSFNATYTESAFDARFVKDAAAVRGCLKKWEKLDQAALSEADTATFLKEIPDRVAKGFGR